MTNTTSEIMSTNPVQTQSIARKIASECTDRAVIALYGDLGSGKTTFTQGVAAYLGIKNHITSPTFLIRKQYTVPDHNVFKMLYHVDLYRIQSREEAEEIGLEEIMREDGAIMLIEWPEKIEEVLPESTTRVLFEYVDENTRKITIKRGRNGK